MSTESAVVEVESVSPKITESQQLQLGIRVAAVKSAEVPLLSYRASRRSSFL